jgi:hypothetical protein
MGLLAGDTRCPACGVATPFGQAAGVSLKGRSIIDSGARAAIDSGARRRYVAKRRRLFIKKKIRSLLLFVAGGLVTAAGVAMYLDARSNQPVARDVTAADLLRIDRPESLPDWIAYNTTKAFDTGVEYAKVTSRQTTSKFLLLPVGDHWLLAEVAGQSQGTSFEGKLGPFDKIALEKVVTSYPNVAKRLLPYQFDATLDIAGTQRRSYFQAGAVGVVGLLVCFAGVCGFFARSPPSPATMQKSLSAVFRLNRPTS